MRQVWLLGIFLMLFYSRGIAQCANNEVEIKVEIITDEYGEETYWTLTDLVGKVILQGGQGGAYTGRTLYMDSICVPADACFFFDIYDGYGDGIFVPGGFKLFVNEIKVSNGVNEFGSKASDILNCPNPCSQTPKALDDLQKHVNGTVALTSNQFTVIRNTFTRFPECLAENESVVLKAKKIVDDYDKVAGPIFINAKTKGGFSKNPNDAPGLDLERTILALQQGLFDHLFTPTGYASFPDIITGWKYLSCANFPGDVSAPSDPSSSKSVLIKANFQDPKGMNPYYDINFERMEHALRPTGLYLSPGSVAKVTVPDSLVGKNYWVRVGSHDWDLTERPQFYRMDRISKRFPIDSTTINVFNPMGGAISILIPYGANQSIVSISVANGVEAPYFSLTSFNEIVDFDAELSKPGPWAVFESDNVMYTIPKHSIVPGEYDLKKTLQDWESALRGVNSILARQIIPDKHNMYMIADLDIRTGVYSIGYPMSNTPLNYTDVPGPAYFINGPGPDDEVNFHESGHAWRISKFPGEEEAFVNFPYIMALNYGLNEDLNEAVKYSFVPNTFNIDRTATHRMVSNTFGTERNLSNTERDEVRYQHRGYGHYFEIVNILGWCALRNFWTKEYLDFQKGINSGFDGNVDDRIVRMSEAAQADLRPLFHVFGIVAKDSLKVQDTLAQLGVFPSMEVYQRLQAYFKLIPANNKAFVDYALSVYPNLYTDGPNDDPNYGVGWHYLKSLTYNEAEAKQRTDILQSIIQLYYPNGAPETQGPKDLCCILDTINISWLNDAVIVKGGVEPYQITVDSMDNVRTVKVVDFDGCESTAQFTLSSIHSDEQIQGLKIYPNPSATAINIEWSAQDRAINQMRLVAVNGQVVQTYLGNERIIDVSALNEGMYILNIILDDGTFVSRRMVIL